MPNSWIAFLKKEGGRGYSMKELKAKYKSRKSPSRRSPSRKSSRRSSRKSSRKSSRRSSIRSPSRSSRRSPRRSSRSPRRRSRVPKKTKECRRFLSRKISRNMDEFKEGRYSSPQQAIAVSYSQVRRRHPSCYGWL